MIKVKNRHTNVVSEFTNAEWDRINKDPQWAGVFVEVKEPRVPKEVKDLQSSQGGTQSGEIKAKAAAVATAETKKEVKKTQQTTGDDKK